MNKRALIFGISGQDGAYLAAFLLGKGYEVMGTSRDAQLTSFTNLERLGVRSRVHLLSANGGDFRSVLEALKRSEPIEIYNLAGQTSVGLSFDLPMETFSSIGIANLNLLEAIRFFGGNIRYYNAGSSECFGNTYEPADEETPFRPRSPYAVAKAAAFWQVANYREAYNIYACSGILFNHESVLRPARFVCKKIVSAASRIARGSKERLHLGNLEIARDWGWAPEYVISMWRMMQQETPEDYVIATGTTSTLKEFVREVFAVLGLEWREHVVHNPELLRPTDILMSRADTSKAEERLSWKARHTMKDLARLLVQAELGAAGQQTNPFEERAYTAPDLVEA